MVRIHIQSLSEVLSQVSTIEYETPFLLKFTLISMEKNRLKIRTNEHGVSHGAVRHRAV